MCHTSLTPYNQINSQGIFHSNWVSALLNEHFFAQGLIKLCIQEKSLLLPLYVNHCYAAWDRQSQTLAGWSQLLMNFGGFPIQSILWRDQGMGSKHNLSRITNHKKSYISPKKKQQYEIDHWWTWHIFSSVCTLWNLKCTYNRNLWPFLPYFSFTMNLHRTGTESLCNAGYQASTE